jgi:hypothetical protein
VKSQITLDFYSQAQAFENEAIEVALQVFFALSEGDFERFLEYIRMYYGEKEVSNVRNNRSYWQNHPTAINYATQKMILACIPLFTDEYTRFEFLKLEFLATIVNYGKFYPPDIFLNSIVIDKLFGEFFGELEHFYTFQPNWYISKAYSIKEVQNTRLVVGYVFENILLENYSQICREFDFVSFKLQYFHDRIAYPKMEFDEFKSKPQEYTYYLKFCGLSIGAFLFNIHKTDTQYYRFKLSDYPRIYEGFEQPCQIYLSEQLLILEKQKEMAQINQIIMQKDWDVFENQYRKMKKSLNHSHFKGSFRTSNSLLMVDIIIPSLGMKIFDWISVYKVLIIFIIALIIIARCVK